jgi:hypothetical protein
VFAEQQLQLQLAKERWPQLQVLQLGMLMTAAEYATVEHGYKESKQVVLTGIKGLAGGVSDGAVSELCGVFAEMEGLISAAGRFGVGCTVHWVVWR